MARHNRCTTTYDADRWDPPTDPWSQLPLASLRGDYATYPCHDAAKDIVMPSFKDPRRWAAEREDDPFFAPRRRLFFFSGDLGSPCAAWRWSSTIPRPSADQPTAPAAPGPHSPTPLPHASCAPPRRRINNRPGAKNAGPHAHANYSLGLRQAAWRAVRADGDPSLEVTGHLEKDWWHSMLRARRRKLRPGLFQAPPAVADPGPGQPQASAILGQSAAWSPGWSSKQALPLSTQVAHAIRGAAAHVRLLRRLPGRRVVGRHLVGRARRLRAGGRDGRHRAALRERPKLRLLRRAHRRGRSAAAAAAPSRHFAAASRRAAARRPRGAPALHVRHSC